MTLSHPDRQTDVCLSPAVNLSECEVGNLSASANERLVRHFQRKYVLYLQAMVNVAFNQGLGLFRIQKNIRQASAAGFSQPCTSRLVGAAGTYRRRRAGLRPAGAPAGQLTVTQLAQSEALLEHGDVRTAAAALGRAAVL